MTAVFFVFVVALLSSASPATAKATPAAPPCVAPPAAVAFLRASCASTLYRLTCYDALIPSGCAFQTSTVKLARAAADVNAASLKNLTARAKELVAHGVPGEAPAIAAEIRDCASASSSASGHAKETAAELARLDAMGDAAKGSQARWAVSNAKTWLSAAMTNEGTCSDGFEDAGAAATASPAGKEVAAGVASVTQHTSNALALVNGIPL